MAHGATFVNGSSFANLIKSWGLVFTLHDVIKATPVIPFIFSTSVDSFTAHMHMCTAHMRMHVVRRRPNRLSTLQYTQDAVLCLKLTQVYFTSFDAAITASAAWATSLNRLPCAFSPCRAPWCDPHVILPRSPVKEVEKKQERESQ
jgi:hypothetical protein